MVAEIIFVITFWLLACFVAGFIEAWWENRQREKEKDRLGRCQDDDK